jgi:hypothetical protein
MAMAPTHHGGGCAIVPKGHWTAERLAKWLCEFLTMSEQDQEIALGALNHVRKKKPLPASILRLIQGDKP